MHIEQLARRDHIAMGRINASAQELGVRFGFEVQPLTQQGHDRAIVAMKQREQVAYILEAVLGALKAEDEKAEKAEAPKPKPKPTRKRAAPKG